MAPNPKVIAAYRAMSSLGIHESKVKPVLKKLLKLYDKNWELIEEENYRALADAIFDDDENKELELELEQEPINKKDREVDNEAAVHEEPVRPLKRLRLRGQEGQSSRLLTGLGPSSTASPLITPRSESGTGPGSSSRLQDNIVDKGKKPVSPQVTLRGRSSVSERTPPRVLFTESAVEPGASQLSNSKTPHPYPFITPKDEPIDEIPDYEVPISMILPETTGKHNGNNTVALQCRNKNVDGEDILPSSNEEATSNAELASSSMGEEASVKITPTVGLSEESEENGTLIARGNKDSAILPHVANGSTTVKSTLALVSPQVPVPCPSGLDDAVLVSKKDGVLLESDGGKELGDHIPQNSFNVMNARKHQLTTDDARAVCTSNDLTKGEEKVKISWVNNSANDIPPLFHYIPRNLVFRDAYVNISLSRIGSEDCCSTCIGNCVLSSKPCFCANKTGGDFAYTAQGVLKEEFLEQCISINRDPQNYSYCKECPLEISKSDGCLEPCKGHLKRKFIKECWSKCGCGRHCGNRIVQRGITCNLQVFLTSDGKGWGLRTLEDLPKGAFVCEFVGEILTVKELHERNLKYPKNGKYTYPILLDAEWDSGVVKDNQALCLYAASYGNAARFINHRCLDANLIEIPVEVEGPSHHYYHFAFFTSRKIAAQEELTWDYGINFDDDDEPVELFQCKCGSKFCRNMKRSNRTIR
ncbi:probable inactive histone-lysine N-methyltransferase SUVR2 isoform X2 [Cicer arietinum]|uniref:Probable inactive histone-lysine N-methyltransferase SUVR2 isoform X3 n=1 Tax=Cicer arietinum TaxID=3827 RepID=A0A1S2XSF8_CICAR|nr:probable inactive histone-lysine N-methyltransferase SUVR2 isoform X3 [Cicer arietinum]